MDSEERARTPIRRVRDSCNQTVIQILRNLLIAGPAQHRTRPTAKTSRADTTRAKINNFLWERLDDASLMTRH